MPESGGGPADQKSAGIADYIQGIEALQKADYKGAAAALTRAVQQDDENLDYLRARGVANTLAENFPAAIADLERVLRLAKRDPEAKLWLAAAYRMSGDPGRGASLFSFDPSLPKDYVEQVYNVMAMEYWQSRTQHAYYDRQKRQRVEVHETIKRLFPEVAGAFARRHEASGAAAAAVVQARMKASFDRGDWPAAIRDLVLLRQSQPDDPGLRSYWALALLGAGDALGAREELTRVLCVWPLWSQGYLARAQAAAMIGDQRRALADLESAQVLGDAQVASARARVEPLLAHPPAEDAPDRFIRSVQADAEFKTLVEDALALHRWFNSRRQRYDEAYQDHIRVLSLAIRDEPKNPDHCERLARFLYDHYGVPVLWDGPRSEGRPLRPQSPAEKSQELARALEQAEAALKLEPRHVNAIATKAWILYTLRRPADAERVADAGLAIEPRNVRLLKIKAQLLADRVAALEMQATALRAGHSETHTERRADGEYRVRTYFPPTAQEVAAAQALEAQAAALRQQAQKLSNEASRVQTAVVPDLIRRAGAQLASGDLAGARRDLQQAYTYEPDRPELIAQLAEVCRRQGDKVSQGAFAILLQPLNETNDSPELKNAWDALTRTAWKSAGQALDRARAIDPADARVFAWRSVMSDHRDPADPKAAQQNRLAALALEEARARLMGTSFMRAPAAPADLVTAREAALSMALRLKLGNAWLAAGQAPRAMEAFDANLSMEQRVGKNDLTQLLPSALMPDPTADPNRLPDAPTLVSLLAWSRIGVARADLAMGKNSEAKREFEAVRAYEANYPGTAEHREMLYDAVARAQLGLAQAAYAANDLDEAFKLLMGEGSRGKLPPDLEKQWRDLTDKVLAARKRRDEDQSQAQQNMTPRQRQIQVLEAEIQQREQERQRLLAQANRPGLSQSQRQALNQAAESFARIIEQQKQALEKLRRGSDEPADPRQAGWRDR